MPKPRRGQAARIEAIIAKHFPSTRPSQLAALSEQLAKSLAIAERYGANPCGLTPCPLVKIHCACDERRLAMAKPEETLTDDEALLLSHRCECCQARRFRLCCCFAKYEDCQHIVVLREEMLHHFDPVKWPWTREQFAVIVLTLLDGYDEPPPPLTAGKRVTKEQELNLFIARAAVQRAGGPSRYGLWHPNDECECDAVGTQAGKGLVRLAARLTRN